MRLKDILNTLGISSNDKTMINDVVLDYKKAKEDSLFIALKGSNIDGYDLIDKCLRNKVGAIFTYKEHQNKKVYKIINLKLKLAQICKLVYENNYNHIKFIGIIGTCGKTTTAEMIYHSLNYLNLNCCYFGTGKVMYQDILIPTNNTTLNPVEFYEVIKKLPLDEIKYIVMEVSSISIVENRLSHLYFDYLIYTNFSQDHLDLHHNLSSYFEAKKYMFSLLEKKI